MERSSALRSRNNTGEWVSTPSGGSQSAGAPGTPESAAGTMTEFRSSVSRTSWPRRLCSRSDSASVFSDLLMYRWI